MFDPTPRFSPRRLATPEEALARIKEIYDANTDYLRGRFTAFTKGESVKGRVRACYPYVQIEVENPKRADTRLSYGFVNHPGVYRTSLTRPDIYAEYYLEQFRQLVRNHHIALEVGISEEPIPIHFAFPNGPHLEADLGPELVSQIREHFDLPDLRTIDDTIVNGTYRTPPGAPHPLALFTAQRVDYSLQRLRHYTGTAPEHFQNYILFTNYQFYIDEFVRRAGELMSEAGNADEKSRRQRYDAFVEPGDVVTPNRNLPPTGEVAGGNAPARLPQMPAYHLKRANSGGITMINIGVGPSNAKTITDHVAVLRPHVWLMLGHCAGLRTSQKLGDYVLAHGYVREDHVLDADLPVTVPVPALAEVQVALEQSVGRVTGLAGYDLKAIMRTGTVATIDNRNWELVDHTDMIQRFSQSRAIALDMESATIAANGFRFRVPYGTLLCVSDKPLHGELKLPGMAQQFYRRQVDQHLRIGMTALELLSELGQDRLHSRKLRSLEESAFQ
jgi:AMP nucleosidase